MNNSVVGGGGGTQWGAYSSSINKKNKFLVILNINFPQLFSLFLAKKTQHRQLTAS
jgi:hypothetical protein